MLQDDISEYFYKRQDYNLEFKINQTLKIDNLNFDKVYYKFSHKLSVVYGVGIFLDSNRCFTFYNTPNPNNTTTTMVKESKDIYTMEEVLDFLEKWSD